MKEALDNSQSLLAMLLLLGTADGPYAGIAAEHWRAEGLTKLLEDQIKENRKALNAPPSS